MIHNCYNMSYAQDKICNIIEWLLYIILCCISVIFMLNVIQNYSEQNTSFSVYHKPRTKLPTLTFCFYHYDSETHIDYAYGLDFVIEYIFEYIFEETNQ